MSAAGLLCGVITIELKGASGGCLRRPVMLHAAGYPQIETPLADLKLGGQAAAGNHGVCLPDGTDILHSNALIVLPEASFATTINVTKTLIKKIYSKQSQTYARKVWV